MHENKLLNRCENLTVALGASGLILIGLGGGACFLGVSTKAIEKLAVALRPHQAVAQRMVNYGAGLAYTGLFFSGSGILIAKTIGEWLADKEFEENMNSNTQNKQCSSCSYFSLSSLLPCAVHPELPSNCSDFTPNS